MIVLKAKKWLFIRQKYELTEIMYAWLLYMVISIIPKNLSGLQYCNEVQVVYI